MTSQRNHSLDILRILACLQVILCHTAGSPIIANFVSPGTSDYALCLGLTAVTRWDIGIFVMLTGFFMVDPQKELSIKKLLSKYVVRIIGALVFWSLFYALTLRKSIYPFGSQEGHFWYLGMVIGVYLSLPILRLIAQNKAILSYFIYAWMAFIVYDYLGNFIALPFSITTNIFVNFVGYALLGYYIRTIFYNADNAANTRRASHIIYLLGILGFIATVALTIISQDDESIFMGYTAPNVIVQAAALLVFGIRHPIHLGRRLGRWTEECSLCTFGIYLIHIWILIQIFNRIHRFIPQPLPLVAICLVVAFGASFAVSYLLRKIPFFRKYII